MAPAVQLQHGDGRCSQCKSFTPAFLAIPRGLSLAGLFCGVWAGTAKKSGLPVLKHSVGMPGIPAGRVGRFGSGYAVCVAAPRWCWTACTALVSGGLGP